MRYHMQLQLTNIYSCVFINDFIFSPATASQTLFDQSMVYMFFLYYPHGIAALIPDSIDRIF